MIVINDQFDQKLIFHQRRNEICMTRLALSRGDRDKNAIDDVNRSGPVSDREIAISLVGEACEDSRPVSPALPSRTRPWMKNALCPFAN
jgi:hypothetical protein